MQQVFGFQRGGASSPQLKLGAFAPIFRSLFYPFLHLRKTDLISRCHSTGDPAGLLQEQRAFCKIALIQVNLGEVACRAWQ
jgi:hypothetical protein